MTEKEKVYGISGLVNRSNFCYLNVAIQVLSHNKLLTNFIFNKEREITEILLKNAGKILKDNLRFKIPVQNNSDSSVENIFRTVPGSFNKNSEVISLELKKKIADKNYTPALLDENEKTIVLNSMLFTQLIKLLKHMWIDNFIIDCTSFKYVFTGIRNAFFHGGQQHDAEEALLSILQQIQDETSQEKNININTTNDVANTLMEMEKILSEIVLLEKDPNKKQEIRLKYDNLNSLRRKNPTNFLLAESVREIKKYYSKSFGTITQLYTGFVYSSTNCPDSNCKYSSNKFESYFHLSLDLPHVDKYSNITIYDCLDEYCKHEILDEQNLWNCDGCNRKVRAVKKLELWTLPPFLTIQLKRFGYSISDKKNNLVYFPTSSSVLDLKKYASPYFNKGSCTYRLQSVIYHTGSMNSGHYYSSSLIEDKTQNQWYMFNDERVKKIYESEVVNENAYMLFYINEDYINKK